jgi:hypothetical protein
MMRAELDAAVKVPSDDQHGLSRLLQHLLEALKVIRGVDQDRRPPRRRNTGAIAARLENERPLLPGRGLRLSGMSNAVLPCHSPRGPAQVTINFRAN